MSEEQEKVQVGYNGNLVRSRDGLTMVAVSHKELDNLVGRLMQLCDLTGDIEQRQALKQEVKWRCREWLDGEYESAGHDKYKGQRVGVTPTQLK